MKRILSLAVLLAPTIVPTMALAHPGHDGGFVTGFVHPFTGADHLLAMTGIGLWAMLLGGRAIWALPLAFLASMATGFALVSAGVLGGLAASIEPAVLASVILLGAALTLALRAPLAMALPAAGLMGLAHGAAHGAEAWGNGLGFAASMLVATGVLHGLGLGLGRSLPNRAMQAAGLATLLAGIGLAFAA